MHSNRSILPYLAPSASKIPVSALHEVHRSVLNRREPTLGLHVGEPVTGMPEVAIEALCKAVRDRRTGYGDAPGLPELRSRLSEKLRERGATPAEVFVTPGSCQAIAAILLSLSSPGATALLPEIHWPTHYQQIVMAGLLPRFFANSPGSDLITALDAAHDPSVCVVILNSPANPSGQVLDGETSAEVYRWAQQHDVWIISDEAYEDFVYEGDPPCFWRLDSEVEPDRRRVFTVHTFSKNYSFTGCRLGYLGAPEIRAAARVSRVQEACIISPSTPVQWAGLAALDDVDHVARHHRYVRETRDAVLERLRDSRLLWMAPAGGWYLLLDVSARCRDAHQFCADLLEKTGVAVAPGPAFVAPAAKVPPLVRIALCADREKTLEGIDRLRTFCEETA